MTTLRELFKKGKQATKDTTNKILDAELENLKPSEKQIKTTKSALSDLGKIVLAFIGFILVLYFISYITEGGYIHETLLFGATGIITYKLSKKFMLGLIVSFLVFFITLIALYSLWSFLEYNFNEILFQVGYYIGLIIGKIKSILI